MSKNKNQEIEENELADWFQKYFDEWKPYMPIVIAGTVIVIAGIIGGTWWYQNRVNSEARIWQELSQARFNAMRLSSRPDEDVSTVGLTDFADTYGDTAAGKWATLQAGVLELDRGLSILNQQLSVKSEQEKADKNLKRAIEHFEKILNDPGDVDSALMRRAIFKMAVAQEATGQLAEAKKYYEQAIEFAGEDSSLYDIAKRGIARCNAPEMKEFYVQLANYKPSYGEVAPGVTNQLPTIPNISFPEEPVGGRPFVPGDEEPKDGAPKDGDKKSDLDSKKDENLPPQPPKSDDKKSDKSKSDDNKGDDKKKDDKKKDDNQ